MVLLVRSRLARVLVAQTLNGASVNYQFFSSLAQFDEAPMVGILIWLNCSICVVGTSERVLRPGRFLHRLGNTHGSTLDLDFAAF